MPRNNDNCATENNNNHEEPSSVQLHLEQVQSQFDSIQQLLNQATCDIFSINAILNTLRQSITFFIESSQLEKALKTFWDKLVQSCLSQPVINLDIRRIVKFHIEGLRLKLMCSRINDEIENTQTRQLEWSIIQGFRSLAKQKMMAIEPHVMDTLREAFSFMRYRAAIVTKKVSQIFKRVPETVLNDWYSGQRTSAIDFVSQETLKQQLSIKKDFEELGKWREMLITSDDDPELIVSLSLLLVGHYYPHDSAFWRKESLFFSLNYDASICDAYFQSVQQCTQKMFDEKEKFLFNKIIFFSACFIDIQEEIRGIKFSASALSLLKKVEYDLSNFPILFQLDMTEKNNLHINFGKLLRFFNSEIENEISDTWQFLERYALTVINARMSDAIKQLLEALFKLTFVGFFISGTVLLTGKGNAIYRKSAEEDYKFLVQAYKKLSKIDTIFQRKENIKDEKCKEEADRDILEQLEKCISLSLEREQGKAKLKKEKKYTTKEALSETERLFERYEKSQMSIARGEWHTGFSFLCDLEFSYREMMSQKEKNKTVVHCLWQLGSIYTSVACFYRHELKKSQKEFTKEICLHLESHQSELFEMSDETRWQQVLFNLGKGMLEYFPCKEKLISELYENLFNKKSHFSYFLALKMAEFFSASDCAQLEKAIQWYQEAIKANAFSFANIKWTNTIYCKISLLNLFFRKFEQEKNNTSLMFNRAVNFLDETGCQVLCELMDQKKHLLETNKKPFFIDCMTKGIESFTIFLTHWEKMLMPLTKEKANSLGKIALAIFYVVDDSRELSLLLQFSLKDFLLPTEKLFRLTRQPLALKEGGIFVVKNEFSIKKFFSIEHFFEKPILAERSNGFIKEKSIKKTWIIELAKKNRNLLWIFFQIPIMPIDLDLMKNVSRRIKKEIFSVWIAPHFLYFDYSYMPKNALLKTSLISIEKQARKFLETAKKNFFYENNRDFYTIEGKKAILINMLSALAWEKIYKNCYFDSSAFGLNKEILSFIKDRIFFNKENSFFLKNNVFFSLGVDYLYVYFVEKMDFMKQSMGTKKKLKNVEKLAYLAKIFLNFLAKTESRLSSFFSVILSDFLFNINLFLKKQENQKIKSISFLQKDRFEEVASCFWDVSDLGEISVVKLQYMTSFIVNTIELRKITNIEFSDSFDCLVEVLGKFNFYKENDLSQGNIAVEVMHTYLSFKLENGFDFIFKKNEAPFFASRGIEKKIARMIFLFLSTVMSVCANMLKIKNFGFYYSFFEGVFEKAIIASEKALKKKSIVSYIFPDKLRTILINLKKVKEIFFLLVNKGINPEISIFEYRFFLEIIEASRERIKIAREVSKIAFLYEKGALEKNQIILQTESIAQRIEGITKNFIMREPIYKKAEIKESLNGVLLEFASLISLFSEFLEKEKIFPTRKNGHFFSVLNWSEQFLTAILSKEDFHEKGISFKSEVCLFIARKLNELKNKKQQLFFVNAAVATYEKSKGNFSPMIPYLAFYLAHFFEEKGDLNGALTWLNRATRKMLSLIDSSREADFWSFLGSIERYRIGIRKCVSIEEKIALFQKEKISEIIGKLFFILKNYKIIFNFYPYNSISVLKGERLTEYFLILFSSNLCLLERDILSKLREMKAFLLQEKKLDNALSLFQKMLTIQEKIADFDFLLVKKDYIQFRPQRNLQESSTLIAWFENFFKAQELDSQYRCEQEKFAKILAMAALCQIQKEQFLHTISYNISMPADVKMLVDFLWSNKIETFLVGGAVRDALFGGERIPSDYDFSCRVPKEKPELIHERIHTVLQKVTFKKIKFFLVGNGAFLIEGLSFPVSVVPFRQVLKKEESKIILKLDNGNYIPFFSSEELEHQHFLSDFLINTAIYDPKNEILRDPFDVITLSKKSPERALQPLCLFGDSLESFFTRDTSAWRRIFRCVRFAVHYDFPIPEAVFGTIKKAAAGLRMYPLSFRRLFNLEWQRLFRPLFFLKMFDFIVEHNLYKSFFLLPDSAAITKEDFVQQRTLIKNFFYGNFSNDGRDWHILLYLAAKYIDPMAQTTDLKTWFGFNDSLLWEKIQLTKVSSKEYVFSHALFFSKEENDKKAPVLTQEIISNSKQWQKMYENRGKY